MSGYPNMTAETSDPYDLAYRWGWENPKYRKLVHACYKTPDFEDNARRFHGSPEFGEAVRLLTELGKPPDKNVRVLDFGCGNGIASYALSRAGYSVLGVDSSLGEIAGIEAARKIIGLDGTDFEIRRSAGERLDFGDGEFDVVWIRETLHHIDDLTGFLSEIRRIVQQEGIVCCLRDVVIWNEDQKRHFYSTHPFYPITKDEGCYYLDQYVTAFEDAGFVLEKTLYPLDSVINTYPNSIPEGNKFDEIAAKSRRTGYDLFSFFARKLESGPVKKENAVSDAMDMMNRGLNEEAIDILESFTVDPNAVYARSVALSRMGRTGEAISALECLGVEIGSLPKAQTLLRELKTVATGKTSNNRNVFQFGKDFYGQVILNPGTLANIAFSENTWKELLSFHNLLATDEYVAYLDRYYRECLNRFGSSWRYIDITNLLFAASKTTQPVNYLEIGVRRGRGVCVVARGCNDVNITACDMWIENYAGMENPGPDFVLAELAKHGHKGNIEFINGDSHKSLPEYFKTKPDLLFDMITVDGDHTEDGAFDDLHNVIPHLAPGGILIFDDIVHPSHKYLLNVWRKTMQQFPFLAGYEYTEAGYGVAFAIRRK
jgi:SAM-dependent methyltransferase/predicted O-methyltransferase YrrM